MVQQMLNKHINNFINKITEDIACYSFMWITRPKNKKKIYFLKNSDLELYIVSYIEQYITVYNCILYTVYILLTVYNITVYWTVYSVGACS